MIRHVGFLHHAEHPAEAVDHVMIGVLLADYIKKIPAQLLQPPVWASSKCARLLSVV